MSSHTSHSTNELAILLLNAQEAYEKFRGAFGSAEEEHKAVLHFSFAYVTYHRYHIGRESSYFMQMPTIDSGIIRSTLSMSLSDLRFLPPSFVAKVASQTWDVVKTLALGRSTAVYIYREVDHEGTHRTVLYTGGSLFYTFDTTRKALSFLDDHWILKPRLEADDVVNCHFDLDLTFRNAVMDLYNSKASHHVGMEVIWGTFGEGWSYVLSAE
ncbi:hypothetical protein DFH05DRAFT_1524221 [Lentinula detonsa]|uniref:Uncharacterized protein n=1 Tax=Lentinula detonsa TaxID=2804962 RepID=A0A9W8P0Q4_9AGAR|nr:hypothetical protein DFH05DRAFT_1524221 [Lentinula detonsa]